MRFHASYIWQPMFGYLGRGKIGFGNQTMSRLFPAPIFMIFNSLIEYVQVLKCKLKKVFSLQQQSSYVSRDIYNMLTPFFSACFDAFRFGWFPKVSRNFLETAEHHKNGWIQRRDAVSYVWALQTTSRIVGPSDSKALLLKVPSMFTLDSDFNLPPCTARTISAIHFLGGNCKMPLLPIWLKR